MKNKTFGILAMIVLSVFAVMTTATATLDPLGITVLDVKLDGDSLNANQALKTNLERNTDVDVRVRFQTDSATSADDVEITVFLTGNKDSISDTTKRFDVKPDTIYSEDVTLDLPQRLDDREYQLRVVISSPNSDTQSYVYPLIVESEDNSVVIKEVTFSPNDQVKAGRAFTAVARLKNFGDNDEDDVKVVVSIPDLGVQKTDYINEIEKDETVSSEEMLLRIPANAETGNYDVDVTVYYDDYDEKSRYTSTIAVISDVQAAASTGVSPATGSVTMNVGPQAQSVARGENGVIYPVTLTNGANTATTYTLTATGVSAWGTSKISPSNVMILNPGEQKTAYVYVAASENAALGEHAFTLDVASGNQVVQQVALRADVLEGASTSGWNGVKKALQVAVILLVVLIVVLGIVIGYQRQGKNDSEDAEDIAQTYY